MTGDDAQDVEQRARRYLANNPDAGVMEVLAQAPGVGPENRDLVVELVDGETPAEDPAPEVSNPGYETAKPPSGDGEGADSPGESEAGRERDLVAEARAVAGGKPITESNSNGGFGCVRHTSAEKNRADDTPDGVDSDGGDETADGPTSRDYTRNPDVCHPDGDGAAEGDFSDSPNARENEATPESVLDAFADAVEFFHSRLDDEVAVDLEGDASTAREYFEGPRGWDTETVEEKRLGWAPADERALLDYLMRHGHDREAILGTGLFTEELRPLWRGRYVFPYFDAEGRPVYAISRATGSAGGGAAGYDGHPEDFMSGKYAKPAHTKEYAAVDEPIYGLDTLGDGDGPVLIAEGIADAITAHEAGYRCVSPVTTQFKKRHREPLLDALRAHGVDRVYLAMDAERPTSDLVEDHDGWDALNVEQFGPGVKGAVATAVYLVEEGDVDARVVDLPRPGLDKVDLDDYLQEWTDGDLGPVLVSATPATAHPAHDPREFAIEVAQHTQVTSERKAGDGSALFDLDIRDVTGLSWDYRGPSPLGHTGESRNYFVLLRDLGVAYDHKRGVAYTPLSYLLVDAGERRAGSPNGSLSPWEMFVAWRHAKAEGHVATDDTIPHAALRGVAFEHGLADRDDLTDGWRLPAEAYNQVLDVVAEEYGVDPGRRPVGDRDGEGVANDPVSALPLERLDALGPEAGKRYARSRGYTWPSTEEARERLRNRIVEAMHHEEDVVIDAPTALGKSYTVATEPWLRRADVTDEQPVVQFSETREARDQAVMKTRSDGGTAAVLKGRREKCPVAAGLHDPADEDDEQAPDVIVTMNGTAASEWFDAVCDGRGVPFSAAHRYLDDHNDQDADLPCCATPKDVDEEDPSDDCPAMKQWQGVPRTDDGHPSVDVIHATHQFAYVPSLVRDCNVVFDERPSFTADLSNDRIQRAVTAYLREIDAPVSTWESFVSLATHEGYQGDAARERDATQEALEQRPDREWYLEDTDAHTLAPALARGLWYALRDDADANGRRASTVPHEPPRLDASAHEEEGWNRVWVTIVVDDSNRVRTVRTAPDMSLARCVVGLDAHPTPALWQRNTKPNIQATRVLDADERRLWRRYERGLTVVQVGDATRPLASGEYFDERGTRTLLEHLRERYGVRFDSVITAASVEQRTTQLMREAGVDDPETMHFGEEKSRDDFGGKAVGLVNGSIDPGDDYVLDLLAECGLDARPETSEGEDGETRRAHGREFVGGDADAAAAFLASVRENHVAQAAGRYARDADDPENGATVFVRTDASPAGFVDLEVPGVEWVATDKQRAVIEELRDRRGATARELAEATGVSKRHVARTLERLAEDGRVDVREGTGEHGADVYHDRGEGDAVGTVDLGPGEITTAPVWGSYTWSVSVSPAEVPDTSPNTPSPPPRRTAPSSQSGLGGFDDGGPPPNDAD